MIQQKRCLCLPLLKLEINVPAELCLNIKTEDGLTNGAACIVKKFDYGMLNSSRCSIVWVKFENDRIGKAWKTRYKYLYRSASYVPHKWMTVLKTCRKFTLQHYKTYINIRR